jgi:hypothetical protein
MTVALNLATLSDLLYAAAAAPHTDAQGKAYEALAAYLFAKVPGCIVERDVTNVFSTEQIDVAVGNIRAADGLPLLPNVLLVECKDWSQPVDSKTVGYFINILAGRGVELGILIAANGITGEGDFKNAHALGFAAAPRGIKVLVITTADIRALTSVEDFGELLTSRYLRAVATGTIGLP